ncbi:MHC class I antigen [Labeo rohita]|uniref:MHC class I antigen n=1 Tax=Labeo rohita TaxID=84645 RepID=A0A498MUK8_LABRO|nr:MHC class I antigen [Labeo rohita]
MGLLDDRQIDYYNSKDQRKIPKQDWIKEKMQQDYWEKGTQSRKSKEQWFNVNIDILMKRMGHNESESQWVTTVDAALPTKRKWDNVPILNQYTKGYLEKECVDWLNKFREYADEDLRNSSLPDVHMFAKKNSDDPSEDPS